MLEPSLGLLGLFEDTNRLAVRLDWLTRPTWRYRRVRALGAVAVMATMLTCVLPMAQAQYVPPINTPNQAQLDAATQQSMQQQLQILQEQQRQFQAQLDYLVTLMNKLTSTPNPPA